MWLAVRHGSYPADVARMLLIVTQFEFEKSVSQRRQGAKETPGPGSFYAGSWKACL
jgi:hypothetical protein